MAGKLDDASMAALGALAGGGSMKEASNQVNEDIKEGLKGLDNPFQSKAVDGTGMVIETEPGGMLTEDPLAKFQGEEESSDEEGSARDLAEADQDEGNEESSEEEGDTETIRVRGVNGRRKTVEVKYDDREAIKKAFISQAGREKFREERDKARSDLQTYRQEISEDLEVSVALQQAYESQGIDGVIGLIGGQDAIEKYVEQKLGERRIWDEATPVERQALEAQRRAEHESKSKSELEKRLDEMQRKLDSKDVEYEEREIEGLLHSSYGKYSFDGSLGNDRDEDALNDTLWIKVTRKLEQVPEDEPVTKAMVEKAFKEESARLRRMFVAQGKKQANKAVAQRKKKAAESVQRKAKNSMASQSGVKEKRKDFFSKLSGGGSGLADAMQMWIRDKDIR